MFPPKPFAKDLNRDGVAGPLGGAWSPSTSDGDGKCATMQRHAVRFDQEISAFPPSAVGVETAVPAFVGYTEAAEVAGVPKTTVAVRIASMMEFEQYFGGGPIPRFKFTPVRGDKGFVKTGADLSPDELATARWPHTRGPYLLETNRPGIFAVGDVRSGNVKRVASAVGEGSIAVAFVHQVLRP